MRAPIFTRIALATALVGVFAAGTSPAQTLNLGPAALVPASTATDYNEMPRVYFADDGTKHLVWVRGTSFETQGVFAMSAASGSLYGSPVMISPGLDGVRIGFSDGLTVRKSGTNVVASWEGTDFFNRPIWFARSTDSGSTWEPAVRADPDLMEERAYTAGALFPDGRVAQVWMEYDTSGGNDLYWRAQDDLGEFGPPSFPAAGSPQVPCDCCNPDQVVLDDGTVLVAYRNNRNNNRTVWVSRSTDGGASFSSSVKLDASGWLWFACPGDPPSMVVDGQDVLVVWKRGPQAVHHIYSARSTDGGATFSPMSLVGGGDGSTDATRPRVDWQGDLAVATWEARDPATTHWEIWVATSLDGGFSWGPEQRITGDGNSALLSQPSVAISPTEEVEIVWKDESGGTRRLYQTSGTVTATGVSAHPPVVSGISLVASPNPFRHGTALRFELPPGAAGEIVIHDLAGRRVTSMAVPPQRGAGELFWNGLAGDGEPVAAGVYFASLRTDRGVRSRMLVRQR